MKKNSRRGVLEPATITPAHSSVEEVLRLLKKALAHRAFVAVAQIGEFLELGLLLRAQMRRDFNIDAHVQITVAVALDVLYAFALEPEHRPRLRSGWNLN